MFSFIIRIFKKMSDTVKKYSKMNPPFHSIFERVLHGEKLEIKFGIHTSFYKIKSIHLTSEMAYVLLDDKNDTRVNFDQITGSRISK